MSLRSVGLQLLQTTPGLLLAGATNASASFWVQVNPGNNVPGAKGVEIFGDTGGKFSATLSGTGSLRLQWSSNDGLSNGVSTCTLALTPGTAYHVAAAWQPGSQQYYLNGFQVEADEQIGSLGVLHDAASHAFRLGSDQSGADVTLDQPTLWVGYALTAQDVINLRNRSAQPAGIAPSSLALGWSLAGPAGVAAKVGDAGLADASPNNLALSSVVGAAPTYQAGDLTYAPSPTIGAVASPSGKSIVVFAQDGTGVGSAIQSISSSSETQFIKLVGQPAGSAFTLGFNGHQTSPIATVAASPNLAITWTIPTVAGHSYTIGVNHPYSGGSSQQIEYECLQSGTAPAPVITSGSPTTGDGDAGFNNAFGVPATWDDIFTNVIATGSTIQLRITGTSNAGFNNAGLRVKDLTASTATHLPVSDPSCSPTPGQFQIVGEGSSYLGQLLMTYGSGGGLGPLYLATGGAPAIQSALNALPGLGPDGVSVADESGQGSGQYLISFVADLTNTFQPLITCSDPAVSISEVSRGGNSPALSINGGSPIILSDWLWVTAGDNPYALGILPQSAPAVQTFAIGSLPYASSGGYWNQDDQPGSLSGLPIYGAAPGLTARFTFQTLPPGTYQVAVTYPTTLAPGYTPATNAQFVVQDAAGTTLAALNVDQSAAPADYKDATGRGWKVLGSFARDLGQDGLTVSMTTSGLANSGNPLACAILDGVQLVRTSADTSVIIGPSDSATLSFPSGWMATSVGPLPATPNVPVSPPSPTSILPAFVADPKSMRVGYNVNVLAPFSNFVDFSNLATRMNPLDGLLDSNGYTTKNGGARISTSVLETNVQAALGDPPTGTYIINTGLFTLSWDGSTTDLFLQPDPGTGIAQVSATITGGLGNEIIYQVQVDPLRSASPGFQLVANSTVVDPSDPSGNTYLFDFRNLKIYPPDPSDPTGQTAWVSPPKFHPWFLYKLQGVQSIRFLDPIGTNNNAVGRFADYKPATYLNRSGSSISANLPIASIRPPVDPSQVTPGYTQMVVQVTTTAPHNLYDGCIVQFRNAGSVNVVGGGTYDLDSNSQQITALCQVVDATNVLVYFQDNNATMTGVATPSGATLAANYGSPWPLQDMVDLIKAVGCSDLWFNVCVSSDASVGGCVDQVAAFLAANLPAGVKVHVEFGNECWNGPFPTSFWTAIKDGFLSGQCIRYRYQGYYARQAKAVHDRFRAVFTSAGRPNDLACVYGGQGGSVNSAIGIAQQVGAIGGRMDEYCVAFYFHNQDSLHGWEASQGSIYNRMTVDHCMDFMEFNSAHGRMDVVTRQTVAALAANGFGSTRMAGYEGSPDCMVPGGGGTNYSVKQDGVKRHPRMYWAMLNQMSVYQDAGLSIWNLFDLGGTSNNDAWDAWESGNPQAGTGDPTLDAINLSDPLAKNLVKSEVGGAWRHWATLVKATTTTTTKKPPRNGQLRTIGIPRGLFRTIR